MRRGDVQRGQRVSNMMDVALVLPTTPHQPAVLEFDLRQLPRLLTKNYDIHDSRDHAMPLLARPRHHNEEMNASSFAANRPVIVALAPDRSVLEHVQLTLRDEPYTLLLTDDRGQFLTAIIDSCATCAVVALGEAATAEVTQLARCVRVRAPCLWTIGFGRVMVVHPRTKSAPYPSVTRSQGYTMLPPSLCLDHFLEGRDCEL